MKKNSKTTILYIISVCVLGIFFFFMLGKSNYCIEPDSGIFMNPSSYVSDKYIIYPFFLHVCQIIFGDSLYLTAVFIIQGALAFGTSILIGEYMRKRYQLNWIIALLIFICSFGPYTYSLPQSVSTHHILTEGLSFPLFNIYMLWLLKHFLENKKWGIILLMIISVLMSLIRTQLMIFVLITLCIGFFDVLQYVFRKFFVGKEIFFSGLLMLGSIFIIGSSVYGVMFCVNNNLISQVTDAMAGRAFSLIEWEDVELAEENDRDFMHAIYNEIDHNKHRIVYFQDGIHQWEDMVESINENTKLVGPFVNSFYENDIIKGKITVQLLYNHLADYFYMTAVLTIQSLVVSIFVHPDVSEVTYIIGYIVAIMLYVLAIVGLIIARTKFKVEWKYLLPMRITLFVIVMLTCITNVFFMGLQRYVVYPFGWFYISTVIALVGIKKSIGGSIG